MWSFLIEQLLRLTNYITIKPSNEQIAGIGKQLLNYTGRLYIYIYIYIYITLDLFIFLPAPCGSE